MTVIGVRDGGFARNEKHNVTFGVIELIAFRRESKPEIYRGFCRPECKHKNILELKKALCNILWNEML